MNTVNEKNNLINYCKRYLGIAVLLAFIFASAPASAQAPTPFICDGRGFVVQDLSAVLNKVNLNGSATLTPILNPAGIEYNNLGFRCDLVGLQRARCWIPPRQIVADKRDQFDLCAKPVKTPEPAAAHRRRGIGVGEQSPVVRFWI